MYGIQYTLYNAIARARARVCVRVRSSICIRIYRACISHTTGARTHTLARTHVYIFFLSIVILSFFPPFIMPLFQPPPTPLEPNHCRCRRRITYNNVRCAHTHRTFII